MEKSDIERIVLKLNKTLKEKYSTDVIFSGTYGLYLNGIVLDREFNDVDVRVVGVDPKLLRKNKFEFEVPIHFLGDTTVQLEHAEVDVSGEKILVYTPQTIINCKKHTVAFNETRKIKNEVTELKKEKEQQDLDFIKEKYGME